MWAKREKKQTTTLARAAAAAAIPSRVEASQAKMSRNGRGL